MGLQAFLTIPKTKVHTSYLVLFGSVTADMFINDRAFIFTVVYLNTIYPLLVGVKYYCMCTFNFSIHNDIAVIMNTELEYILIKLHTNK